MQTQELADPETEGLHEEKKVVYQGLTSVGDGHDSCHGLMSQGICCLSGTQNIEERLTRLNKSLDYSSIWVSSLLLIHLGISNVARGVSILKVMRIQDM